MDLGLRGRVALVASSSKGLGRAIAETLAAEGTRVVLCARGAQDLDATCGAIRDAGGRCHGVVADVSQPADVGRVAATRLLLSSAVGFARAVVPNMRASKWGRIINVTSIAAKQPVDGLMLSNSLRAGVVGFARTLSTEVAADGITVNNLLPGYTRTQRVVDLSGQMATSGGTTPDEILRRWEAEIPMRRLGEPREFAALAAFLASEQAGYITGQSIAVDGGWIRGLF
jgi:3-oxoacyl-[acyl-carrier protein] reductase